MSTKYAFLLSYVGTSFVGWQRQKHHSSSIQQILEEAFFSVTQEKVTCVASGRTDAGVHACAQVVHCFLQKKWIPERLQLACNAYLPKSIRILKIKIISSEFHAQKSALKKQYSYYFQQGFAALPLCEPYTWWIRKNLDIEKMQEAAHFLRGVHDFQAFQSSGTLLRSTVREIFEAKVSIEVPSFPDFLGISKEFYLVRLCLVGSGFLKQMVRTLAGSILQVGEGRKSPLWIQEVLAAKNRRNAGITAPARALWLERIWYSDHFDLF